MSEKQFFVDLLDDDTTFARDHGAIPATRAALYGGNAAVGEKPRMALWALGVGVRDTAPDLNEWMSR